jgi:hypothetical protein
MRICKAEVSFLAPAFAVCPLLWEKPRNLRRRKEKKRI